MILPPIAIRPRLVAPLAPQVPEGFVDLDVALTAGLPHRIPLSDGLALVLVIPTGVARTWVGQDPATVVTASDAELVSPAGGEELGGVARAPARLLVERGGTTLAVLPLSAGLRRVAADAGGQVGALIEVVIVGWEIRAGTLRGPGDFGSRLRLGWREARAAEVTFLRPPVAPAIRSRIRREEAS
jgi:hypothetical protein